jgi:hypothetical protein
MKKIIFLSILFLFCFITLQTFNCFAQSDKGVNPKLSLHTVRHKNVHTSSDTSITFSFEQEPIICGNPSYYVFDIMAISNYNTIFNNCVLDIQYSMNEFLGDNVNNGGVIVTQGVDCHPFSSDNDYGILNTVNLSDSVIEITFGDASDISPSGTHLDATKSLLTVKLKIQSCQTSTISFVDYGAASPSDYTVVTETIDYITKDSTVTGSYPCDYYYYDCSQDCLDTTDYDSSYCCLQGHHTCYTYSYTYDTTFNYTCNNVPYSGINYSGDFTAATCPLSIISYTNPINAGTNAKSDPPISSIPYNSSILTITGTGFGNNDKANEFIIVTDANQGAQLVLDTSDILSWSENQIVIKMPSYSFTTKDSLTPGSGQFYLINPCGKSSAYNSLQINYNILNPATSGQIKLRPNIVMVNNSESLNFRCDSASMANYPKAKACIKKAIKEWNCYTGVNWKLGPDTTLAKTKQDKISNIYFTDTFPYNNILMATKPWYLTNTDYDAIDSITFTDEADISINNSINWSYDTTGTFTDSVYFYDVILHELGHAHGLGHINDTKSLMYWNESAWVQRVNITSGSTYPGPASLLGGLDMVSTSVAHTPASLGGCPFTMLVQSTINCKDPTLNIPVISENVNNNLNLYPNPINSGYITIAYQLNNNTNIQFKILDCTGRVVINLDNEHKVAGTYTEQVNIDALVDGIYLFTANINGIYKTIKFIKL